MSERPESEKSTSPAGQPGRVTWKGRAFGKVSYASEGDAGRDLRRPSGSGTSAAGSEDSVCPARTTGERRRAS